jgi:hypothetical protein
MILYRFHPLPVISLLGCFLLWICVWVTDYQQVSLTVKSTGGVGTTVTVRKSPSTQILHKDVSSSSKSPLSVVWLMSIGGSVR